MFRHTPRDFQTVLLILVGRTLKIKTLVDAANALLSHWPDDDGEEYVIAVKKCLDAIIGVSQANHARQALIAAANEAGMRVISLAHDAAAAPDHGRDAA